MSVIGKKLNPIQSSGHSDDTTTARSNNKENLATITPDEVLRLTSIADDYLCRPGKHLSTFR